MVDYLNAQLLGQTIGRENKGLLVRWTRIFAVGMVMVLTGCTSLGIGSSEYACPGMPDGVQCMSTRDVYAATNDGNVPRPMVAGEEILPSVHDAAPRGQELGVSDAAQLNFINTYVAPHLPDQPVPIRTPAQVMRIWIAPWEDTNGDLITTGYVHTEIEPRRWVISDQVPTTDPILQPLTVSR